MEVPQAMAAMRPRAASAYPASAGIIDRPFRSARKIG
jgi:hypothetical protein